MPWFSKQPDLKNNPLYLEPRVSEVESSVAQIATNVISKTDLDNSLSLNSPLTLNVTGTININSSMTIPENIKLVFSKGGLLSVANGVTLTLNCTIIAGLTQIFSGLGQITGNPKVTEVYPEWFGGKTHAEVKKAVDLVGVYGGVVKLSNGEYDFTAGGSYVVGLKSNVQIKGNGMYNTKIKMNNTFGWAFLGAKGSNISNVIISDLSCVGGNLLLTYGGSNYLIENIYVNGYVLTDPKWNAGQLIYFNGTDDTIVRNCKLVDFHNGVYFGFVDYGDSVFIRCNRGLVEGCTFSQEHLGDWDNPVGVYLYYSNHVTIRDCTFFTIEAGQGASGGTTYPSTACGYGIYAGDIAPGDVTGDNTVTNLNIVNNTFDFSVLKNTPVDRQTILIWKITRDVTVDGNKFIGNALTFLGGDNVIFSRNKMNSGGLTVYGGKKAIIDSNILKDSTSDGIKIGQTSSVDYVTITNNTITRPAKNGISLVQCDKIIVIGNTIEEPVFQQAITDGSGIYSSQGYQVTAVGNTIIKGSGYAYFGIRLSSHRFYFNSVESNNIIGNFTSAIENGIVASPTSGYWYKGAKVYNTKPSAGGTFGWICIFSKYTSLSALGASGSTTITIGDGTGSLNGDIIGIVRGDGTGGFYKSNVLWTTITSGGGTNSLTINNALPENANANNEVYICRWIKLV